MRDGLRATRTKEAELFFGRLKEVTRTVLFDAAESREEQFTLGPEPLRIHFGSASLARLGNSLRHLETAPSEGGGLELSIWESTPTGCLPPSPPWTVDAYGPQGTVRGYNDERFFTMYQFGMDALYMLDLKAGEGICWIRDADAIPWWEWVSPFRTVFGRLALTRSMVLLHAAAVATDQGAVLLAGPSGSGKSTTALLCATAGMAYLGDDSVLVRLGPRPRVYSVYRTAKLSWSSLRRFPQLRLWVDRPIEAANGKVIIAYNDNGSRRLPTDRPLKAIVIPEVAPDRETDIESLPAAECLRSLAPSSVLQLPGTPAAAFHAISGMVKNLPAFRLRIGCDSGPIPGIIEKLFDGITG